jgi:hypothetical protein
LFDQQRHTQTTHSPTRKITTNNNNRSDKDVFSSTAQMYHRKIAQTVLTNFAKLSRRKTVHFIIPPVSTNFAIFAAQSRSLAGSILSGNFALYFTDVFSDLGL